MTTQLGDTVDVRVIISGGSRLKRGKVVARTIEEHRRFDVKFDDDSSIAVNVDESVIQKVEDDDDQTPET